MMLLGLLLAANTPVVSADAATRDLRSGLSGALRGCEEWVLNPASWADGSAPFVTKVGLGDKMGLVDQAAEETLPPPALRRANHYWRINATLTAGYMLVVSDELPMCHVTGGGDVDLQPIVEAELASPDFVKRWQRLSDKRHGDMLSTTYQNLAHRKFSMIVSRAARPGLRRDRVQVIATATYTIE